MLNNRWIMLAALLVVSVAISACAPPATPSAEPFTPIPTAAAPTATLEPTNEPTLTITAPEAISAGNVDRLSPLSTLALPTPINTLAFTPNSLTLAAATPNGVGLFDVATGQQTNTLASGAPVWRMAFSPDNLTFVMIPSDQFIEPVIWDLAANVPSTLLADQLADIAGMGFSADQTMVATGAQTGVVTVYRLESGTTSVLWSVDINTLEMVIDLQFGTPIPVSDVVFSPDGTQLAASSAGLGVLVIFDVSDGSVASSGSAMNHIAGPVATAMLAPNDWGKVYWLSRGSVIAVDLATNEEAGIFSHEDFILGIAFSADGSVLATASGATLSGTFQPVITLWDTSNFEILRQITGFTQVPPALAFAPDGTKLAVGLNGEGISLWGLTLTQ